MAALMPGCGPAPAPVSQEKPDPTREEWYGGSVELLKGMNAEAEKLLKAGRTAEAGEILTKGQPLAKRLVAVPRPTVAALEAASDLDELHARLLITRKDYGWARMLFQKNLARWKNQDPRRKKSAQDGIAECDRLMGQ
jgi:hypothetical protein